MCWTIRFIGCHHVSPQGEKSGVGKREIKGKSMGKVPDKRNGRGQKQAKTGKRQPEIKGK